MKKRNSRSRRNSQANVKTCENVRTISQALTILTIALYAKGPNFTAKLTGNNWRSVMRVFAQLRTAGLLKATRIPGVPGRRFTYAMARKPLWEKQILPKAINVLLEKQPGVALDLLRSNGYPDARPDRAVKSQIHRLYYYYSINPY